jgi:sterol desaturase/sphingolipid hydroxylase (fatty acid hydroxylase superfamily)
MTPLTALRNHPVEQIVGSLVATPILGVTIGLASYWLMEAPQPITLFGAQLMMVFFYSCCAVHLRHSHVWLSWSPSLSHLVISPAQHQIHHSSAPRHWNKNYGNVLAIWDWMFGSLYVPREREGFAFGLADEQPHPTLLKAYLEPLAGAVKVATGSMRIRHSVGPGDHNG